MSETPRQSALRSLAAELLASGEVKVVIGHEPGTRGRRRPLLARTPAAAARLVHDEACWHNLAVYLTKPELRRLGKAAIVATPAVLRTLLQLAQERQLDEDAVLPLVVDPDGTARRMGSLAEVEAQLAGVSEQVPPPARAAIETLTAMSVAERRAFWERELGRCLRCYACRAACPMCYCERCATECNRPQWIPVASHGLGNLEYHLMRAMHLAGRCVECGSCARACPVGIPVGLLAVYAEESVRRQLEGARPEGGRREYALSAFRPGDEESFIR
jgi:ferredoxin